MSDKPALPVAVIEKLALHGDVSSLKPDEKILYYQALCNRVGLDPATQPFKLMKLQGKEVFYCDRGGCQQLNHKHSISHEIRTRETVNDCYVVTARASIGERFQDSLGEVPLKGLQGEALCNAMMKGETKAKRRATLDLVGLGLLDEMEVETIPGVATATVLPISEELAAKQDNKTPPASKPTSTPAPLAEALASLQDGETCQIEKAFDRIEAPPAGKKAHKVYFVGDDRDYPTMHNFDGVKQGDKMLVTFRASDFNRKLYYWVDAYENLQADELPMGDAHEPPEEKPVDLRPPSMTEIWPSDTFTDGTIEICTRILNVIEPTKGKGKSMRPASVIIELDGKKTYLSTFDPKMESLARALGAGSEEVWLAYVEVPNGDFTNRNLVGLRK